MPRDATDRRQRVAGVDRQQRQPVPRGALLDPDADRSGGRGVDHAGERDRHDARDRVGDPGERRRGQVEVPRLALRALVGDRDPDRAFRAGDVEDGAAGGGAAVVRRRQGHVRARGRGVRVAAVGQLGERVEGRRPGPGRAGRRPRGGRRRGPPLPGGGGRCRRRAVARPQRSGRDRGRPRGPGRRARGRRGTAAGAGVVGGAVADGTGRSSDSRRRRPAVPRRRRRARPPRPSRPRSGRRPAARPAAAARSGVSQAPPRAAQYPAVRPGGRAPPHRPLRVRTTAAYRDPDGRADPR